MVVYIKIRGANLILVPMPSVESKTMHQSLSWDSRSRSSKERLIFKSALISSSILRSYIFTDGQFNPVHVRLILLFQGPLACPCGGVTGLFCRKTTSTYTSGSINWLRNKDVDSGFVPWTHSRRGGPRLRQHQTGAHPTRIPGQTQGAPL